MIKSATLDRLRESKNLLAFSAGVDSSALFFLLLEQNIEFDIAIVNYNLREESKDEVAYAVEIANRYSKKIYISNSPKFSRNFEANARDFRYNFFKSVIDKEGYDNLLTAHHLNDRLEWMLMRLSKGAGALTLSGMREIEKKESYSLIRPLLDSTKAQLLNFLEDRGIKYFIDKSNFDLKYERNRYRPIAEALLENSKDGFIRSFNLLEQEANIVKSGFSLIYSKKSLRVIKIDSIDIAPYALNYYLKELNYLATYNELELIKRKNSIVVGRKWAVEIKNNYLFIAPYLNIVIPKKDRDYFRVNKIPVKIRAYLFLENIDIDINFRT